MAINVFVVWDFTIVGLKITLESLEQSPPPGYRVQVPGLSLQAGPILDRIVLQGLSEADRVLVITDKPNANVGFEAGLALGLGKRLLFAHFGHDLPGWSSQPPLRNYLQGRFGNINELEELLVQEPAWFPGRPASALPDHGPCLDLCPERGEGAALRRKRASLALAGWKRPPKHPFPLTELEEHFSDATRLVWTIANYPEGAEERDGAENAANAIVAGWFFARCLQLSPPALNDRFSVIRSASSREVVDVHLYEKEIDSLDAYGRHIERIEETWRASLAPSPEPALTKGRQVPAGESSGLRIAVLAFKDIGRPDEDEGYSDGFTEWVIADLGTVTDRYSELVLIPRQDVINVEEQNLSIAQLGEDLRAHYILEGSFDRTKDPCHFTARLIDVAADRYLSPVRFSQDWTLHDQASRRIAEYALESLLEKLEPEDRQALAARPERDHAAVMAFWNGQTNRRQFNNLRQEKYFHNAEAFFKKALELDPGFDDALSELGLLYILHWETDSRPDWLEESRRQWEQVREIEDDHPFALAELGYLAYVQKGDVERAVRMSRKAVAADPEHPFAHNVLALLYLYLGFYESNLVIEREEVFHRALGYIYPYTNSALALQLKEDFKQALELAREARKMESNAMVAVLLEGAQHFYLGELDAAGAIWRDGLRVCPPTVTPILEVVLGWIEAQQGRRAPALRLVRAHRGDSWLRGPYAPYYISLCALAGEKDLAVDLLGKETTFASSYRYLVCERTLAALAPHPGFQDLLESRHATWLENLDHLAPDLPEQPPRLPTPEEFLSRSAH